MPEQNDHCGVDPAFKHICKSATGFLIWRVENMQLVLLPADLYGTFYEGDSYLIYAASEFAKFVGPRTKAYEVRGRLEIHIHFWLGAKTSADESTIAAYKCVELDTYLGGTPTQHRETQGQESPRFKGYFKKGIRLLKGGVVSGLHHVEDTFEARLFRVKGRRSPIITQMPSISWEYINSGDVFILDTKEVTFVWIGRNSNNIEKLKATATAQEIRDERGGLSLVFVDDGKESELSDSERTVFSLYLDPKNRHGLHTDCNSGSNHPAQENVADATHVSELRLYKCVDEGGTCRIFEIKTANLRRSDLTSDDTYIVDHYGQTVWVWLGRNASKKERIDAIRNAHGFVKKKNYPSYIPVCRVMEDGEPIEFRSLFCSWKDYDANNIGSNSCTSVTANKSKAMPANLSTQTLHNTPKLAAHLQLIDDAHGKLSLWRVKNCSLKDVPYFMYGRFYSRTCYVIHYKYTYNSREYHVLYCWLGNHSSSTDRITAMQSLQSKNEFINNRGTLVYIREGNETPHFLGIFRGRMTTFIDEHRDEVPSRFLLHVTGSRYYDSCAKQVPVKTSSLDSNDVFVLHCSDKICYVWCGKGSTGDQREMAKSIANKLSSSEELSVIYEGHEKNEFWKQIGGSGEYARDKKANFEDESHLLVRLFHCYDSANNLKTEEIMNFQQSDLLSDDVMLLDNKRIIYVWMGELVKNEEKKHAYDTAIEFLKRDASERDLKTPIVVIREGHEPVTFVGFFETWDHEILNKRKTFAQIRTEVEKHNPTLHIRIKSNDETYDFEECEKFPIEKLLVKNPEQLPIGVDPSHKELHLRHDEFFAVFGMKYAEFCQLAHWKRANMKKSADLF